MDQAVPPQHVDHFKYLLDGHIVDVEAIPCGLEPKPLHHGSCLLVNSDLGLVLNGSYIWETLLVVMRWQWIMLRQAAFILLSPSFSLSHALFYCCVSLAFFVIVIHCPLSLWLSSVIIVVHHLSVVVHLCHYLHHCRYHHRRRRSCSQSPKLQLLLPQCRLH